MSAVPYVDTSALAKWYVNEPRSEDFEAFLTQYSSAVISRLAVVEFRCLLARKRRAGEISVHIEQTVLSEFSHDARAGFLLVHPLEDRHAVAAVELLVRLAKHPLRTLDALHLAVAMDLRAGVLATADRVMAAAADSVGFKVARFD